MSKKTTKRALWTSALSLILCFTMLLGTTYAWFTDSVTSGGNIIKSGTLDVEMAWADGTESPAAENIWTDASKGAIFNYELWEPGYTEVRHISIANVGTLALKYQLRIVANGNLKVNPKGHTLADVIDVYYHDPAVPAADRNFEVFEKLGTLSQVLAGISDISNTAAGVLVPAGKEGNGLNSSEKVTIALKMREDAGNEYQNMNIGASFSVQLLATQWTYEEDSFNDQYDALADGMPDHPVFPIEADAAPYSEDSENPTMVETDTAKVTLPAADVTTDNGTPLEVGENVNLTVQEVDTPANFTVTDGNGTTSYEVSLKTDSGAKIVSTGDAFRVELKIGVVDLQRFAHNGIDMEPVGSVINLADGKYHYDDVNGIVTFMTTSFSPFTSEYLFAGGLGTEAHPYLVSNEKEFRNIGNYYSTYTYFKVKDGVSIIDLGAYEDYGVKYLNGSFDGNNCSFINVKNSLFHYVMGYNEMYQTAEIKNLTATVDISSTTNKGLVYYAFNCGGLSFKNVTVHGQIEGYMGASFVGFYEGLNTNTYKDVLSFDNCYSDATLISLNERAAGFVANMYYAYGTIEINNSEYNGVQYTKSGGFSYIHGMANSNIDLVFDESAVLLAQNHTTMSLTAGTKYTTNAGGKPLYDKDPVKAIRIDNETINGSYQLGDSISVTAKSGAQYAMATLYIGPNTISNGGNFVGSFMTERIDAVVDGQFTTSTVKYCHCLVNPSGCGETESHYDAETNSYHVHNTYYDANTCNSAFVTIVQYDENDVVLSTAVLNLPKN